MIAAVEKEVGDESRVEPSEDDAAAFACMMLFALDYRWATALFMGIILPEPEEPQMVPVDVAVGALLVSLGHKGDCDATVSELMQKRDQISGSNPASTLAPIIEGKVSTFGEKGGYVFARLLKWEGLEIDTGSLYEMMLSVIGSSSLAVASHRLFGTIDRLMQSAPARVTASESRYQKDRVPVMV